MLVFVILSVLLTVRGQDPDQDNITHDSDHNRIVGGFRCSTRDHGYAVSLVRPSKPYHYCGGTLIRLNWVLTAAHCLTPFRHDPDRITVAAGVTGKNPQGDQRIGVKELLISYRYDPRSMAHDIGLILLKKPFKRGRNVYTIDLVPHSVKGELTNFCEKGMVVGWGVREVHNPHVSMDPVTNYVFQGDLHCVELPIMTYNKCRSMISMPMIPTAFCALVRRGGKDACKGDSGGPFLCKGYVVGIVSTGFGCALPGVPGFYTRVDRQLNYIHETMARRSVALRAVDSNNSNKFSASFFVLNFAIIIMILYMYLI